MTTDELCAAADELVVLHRRFAPLFGRKEAREHSLVYLRGLLSAEGRKSVEPMALVFGKAAADPDEAQREVLAMQRFLTLSPWGVAAVQREIQQVFLEQLVPSITSTRTAVV